MTDEPTIPTFDDVEGEDEPQDTVPDDGLPDDVPDGDAGAGEPEEDDQ